MPVDSKGRYFEGGRPIEVEGGIAVRAKRGKIGEQWWSRRFVDVLEQICDGGRLARGRAYARKGQVIDFALSAGRGTAPGPRSKPQPHAGAVAVAPLDEGPWGELAQARGRPGPLPAALLA